MHDPILRRVLIVAYYFPPKGLSGVQRVAKFVKYLPAYGWQPTVLTVEPGGYFAYDESLLHDVEQAKIVRTPSWDPTRLFGKATTVALPAEQTRKTLSTLSQFFFVPDNKIGWWPYAVRAGLKMLRGGSYDAIFSTAPPYSGHLIAASLSRRSGLPLVLDFRDDWVENPRHVYPTGLHRWLNARLEKRVVAAASHGFTINEPIRRALQERGAYAGLRPSLSVLPQGYDGEDFDVAPKTGDPGKMTLLYSGIFYDAQTPDFFLRALAALVARKPALRDELAAVFVGLLPEKSQALAARLGIADLVQCPGYLPHDEAVAHLKGADVLWMTIGRRPGAEGISTGKLYEYMGARKPILALVPDGAAKNALAPYGAARIVPPDDVQAISAALESLHQQWKASRLPVPDEAYVQQFSRKRLTGILADRLSSSIALSPPEH